MFCSFIKKYLFSFLFFQVYILSLIMSSSCMYSGMDLDHSYFSFSVTVYQFVNFLCFKCSTCAHLHTHKKWMLWNCKKWWVWIYLGYSTTGQCRKSFKTTWIRKSDRTKCNRASYFHAMVTTLRWVDFDYIYTNVSLVHW